MKHPLDSAAAICGLGVTDMGRIYRDATDFAAEAVYLALADAGLDKSELDGLLINAGVSRGVDIPLHQTLGLQELSLLTFMQGHGSSAAQMVQYAAMAVQNGLANYVACVFGDAPLQAGERTGKAYSSAGRYYQGMGSLLPIFGFSGAIPMYAMAARRHMDLFGTTQDQLAQVAISQREWAVDNERATKREPLDLESYNASPWVAEPFHVVDCCLVSNGGVAVIVTSAERARDLAKPPVYIRGVGQAHNHDVGWAGYDPLIETPGTRSGKKAFDMAGMTLADVTQCQLYDCYTYTVVATLEDYGFCEKGEGGPFVEDGKLGPGGSLPTNTGGGELSAYYMWGMTPISEAVVQGRGHGGTRQAPNDVILVTGNGGILNYHATLLLSPQAA